jgi:hypothetical protein
MEFIKEILSLGSNLTTNENIKNALSLANTEIKGKLISKCLPLYKKENTTDTDECDDTGFEDYCTMNIKNKIDIDNIVNYYTLSHLFLAMESYSQLENNKYKLYQQKTDDLFADFLNTFRDTCIVDNKCDVHYYIPEQIEHCHNMRY